MRDFRDIAQFIIPPNLSDLSSKIPQTHRELVLELDKHQILSRLPEGTPALPLRSFRFFELPSEIRNKIYRLLIGRLVVQVGQSSITIWKREDLDRYGRRLLSRSPYARIHNNWLCSSKRFFFEARSVVCSQIALSYERRWDFIHAQINRSIHHRLTDVVTAADSVSLFSQSINVFQHVRELKINLSWSSDFDGRVTTAEARRLTSTMLEAIRHNVPLLSTLTFVVDGKARISTKDEQIFLPEIWFLEGLLNVKQVKTVALHHGHGWSGTRSEPQMHKRVCLTACSAVIGAHFKAADGYHRLDCDGLSGVALQARLARRMYRYMVRKDIWWKTAKVLAVKVNALQAWQW